MGCGKYDIAGRSALTPHPAGRRVIFSYPTPRLGSSNPLKYHRLYSDKAPVSLHSITGNEIEEGAEHHTLSPFFIRASRTRSRPCGVIIAVRQRLVFWTEHGCCRGLR